MSGKDPSIHGMIEDITLVEPSMTAGEVEMLLFSIERSRAQFSWKCGDLDADGLRRTFPPSTMTIGGLIKHVALVEDYYAAIHLGRPMGPPWKQEYFDEDFDWAWHSAADDSPEELYELWRAATARSREAWAEALAGGGLDRPSRFTSPDGLTPNLRRVLVDLTDEYARHVGHADLFREAIDGLVGEDPPQR
jgi:hypothetical protein